MDAGRPCGGCAGGKGGHVGVPAFTQYATAALIEAIVYRGHDPGDDPGWASSGAASQAEYARWCGHLCGLSCLRMALHHRDGAAPPLFDLLPAARGFGAYTEDASGGIRGLIYAPFAEMVREVHGLGAQVHRELPVDGLRRLLAEGCLVLASVHREIRRPGRAAPGRGGHLVLVTGHDADTDRLAFRNPSGHTAETRRAELPAEAFDRFFARRGVALSLR